MKRAGPTPLHGDFRVTLQLWRSHLRRNVSQLYRRLPSPDHEHWEEESPEHVTVKSNTDSVQVRRRAAAVPGILLKGPTHGITC